MLRRICQFKTYKDLFNNIEDEWDRSYFMEDDFAGREDTPTTATDVDEINTWNETTTDDPVEAEILVEVNEVYHKNGRYPAHLGYWAPGPRPQNSRAPFRGGRGYQKTFTPRYNNPRHQNTAVANQAYTFNSTTLNANINYAPGTFNMGPPFNTYQVPYNQQLNQTYAQNQQYHNNSFAEQSKKTTQPDATTIMEQLKQLLLSHKNPVHQVNKVKLTASQPGTMWDLKAAAELPTAQEDQSE